MLNKLIGQTLNRYKIIALLGSGGMGTVFKAHDISLQRDVAIKVMHPHIAGQKDFQERFLQEARTAARLDHPGIVQVYDFGHRPYLYIVMKFIPGDNLATMLRSMGEKHRLMLLPEALQLIRLTALALDYAHHNGVLHRDIKPGNIMIEPVPTDTLPYRPVITDLGLAKLAGSGVVTSEGSSMGTPAYMSPEQALGQDTDARSDVYSLGVLLFELATGKLPFPAKTLTEAIHYHTKQPPPRPRSVQPELPQAIEEIILKAMEKDPASRYANAAALAAALAPFAVEATTAAESTVTSDSVSLITEYQNSLIEPRGDSILEDFATPPNLKRDHVQVMTAGKTVGNVPMKADGLTIGRDADNDIVLDDPKVSRHHARIDYDGTEYRVLDLNSSNGTFLANNRLLPGMSDTWNANKALRIGNSWLRLTRGESGATATSTATRFDTGRVVSSPGPGHVGVFLENSNISVEPGQGRVILLVLINQGDLVDHFQVSVNGIPGEWTPDLPKRVYLMPGDQQEVSLSIQPPRKPESRAGRYPMSFLVTSEADPSQVAEAKVTLTVSPFSQFSSELRPLRIRAGQSAHVIVNNLGNLVETFSIQFSDPANELTFKPPQSQVRVPEGGSTALAYHAQNSNPRLIGGEKMHPFTARVSLPKEEHQNLHAEMISRGLIPIWIPPLVLLFCLFLIAATAGIYRQGQTSSAETQTATALISDLDHDELMLEEELAYRCNANKEDTDGDGLRDGEEKVWGTDCNVRDSDDDSLDDGFEVHEKKTHPRNRDTDGDNFPDNNDPDPGQPPTFTPSPLTTTVLLPTTVAPTTAAPPAAAVPTTQIPTTEVPIPPLVPAFKIQRFCQTSEQTHHPQAQVDVSTDYKIIGGGAIVHWTGAGAFLTASYPDGFQRWVAAGKDHDISDPSSITACVLALFDPEDIWEVQIFQNTSESSHYPVARVTVPADYTMVGGGARIDWSGAGNLLTASYPSSSSSWEAQGKDHLASSPATVTVFAIGIRPKNGNPMQRFPETKQFCRDDTFAPGVVDSRETIDPEYTLLSGGAIVHWSQPNPGSMLTASYPDSETSWSAIGKDHLVTSPSFLTVCLIGFKPLNP